MTNFDETDRTLTAFWSMRRAGVHELRFEELQASASTLQRLITHGLVVDLNGFDIFELTPFGEVYVETLYRAADNGITVENTTYENELRPASPRFRAQTLTELRRAFARYPNRVVPVSMYCDERTARRLRNTKALSLSPDDVAQLLDYVGDIRSFKHFLPRLLEAAIEPHGPVLTWLFNRNDFATWPNEERDAVVTFLLAHGVDAQAVTGGA